MQLVVKSHPQSLFVARGNYQQLPTSTKVSNECSSLNPSLDLQEPAKYHQLYCYF